MTWTSARVTGSILAAATVTLAFATPASAAPLSKGPGVGWEPPIP